MTSRSSTATADAVADRMCVDLDRLAGCCGESGAELVRIADRRSCGRDVWAVADWLHLDVAPLLHRLSGDRRLPSQVRRDAGELACEAHVKASRIYDKT